MSRDSSLNAPLDLLAIAAHPDDVELTCGGTVLKMSQAGYRTGILDLTRGETGSRGTPETRLREAANAAKLLGVNVRRNLGLPDARLALTDDFKIAVAEVIRELQPHTIILPYWEGRHPDHYNASNLGFEAAFIAGLKAYPMKGDPFRPFKILYTTSDATPRPTFAMDRARPTFAVDITKQYESRRRAILTYKSQFTPPQKSPKSSKSQVYLPLDELEGRMSDQARHYGRMIGVKYAEGFVMKEVMRIDDVITIPVRSI